MKSRPWPWLRDRIIGLFYVPVSVDPAGHPVFRTRVQAHFISDRDEGVS